MVGRLRGLKRITWTRITRNKADFADCGWYAVLNLKHDHASCELRAASCQCSQLPFSSLPKTLDIMACCGVTYGWENSVFTEVKKAARGWPGKGMEK